MIRGIGDILRLRLFRRYRESEDTCPAPPPCDEEAKETAIIPPAVYSTPSSRIAPIIIWDLEDGLCFGSMNNSQSNSQAGESVVGPNDDREDYMHASSSSKKLLYPSAVFSKQLFCTAQAVHVSGSRKQQQVLGSFSYGPLQTGARFPYAGCHTITATFIPDDFMRYSSVADSKVVFVHKRQCRLQWRPPYTTLLLGQQLTPDFFSCTTETGEDEAGISYSHNEQSELALGANAIRATYTPSALYTRMWEPSSLALTLQVEPPDVDLYWADKVFHASAAEKTITEEEHRRRREQARLIFVLYLFEEAEQTIFDRTLDGFLLHLFVGAFALENFAVETPREAAAAETTGAAEVLGDVAETRHSGGGAVDAIYSSEVEDTLSIEEQVASVGDVSDNFPPSLSGASSSVAELSLGQLHSLQPFMVQERRVARPAHVPAPSELRRLPFEEIEFAVPKTEGELRLLVRRDSDEDGGDGGALIVHGFKPGSLAEQQALLQPGDEIVRANGYDVEGLTLEDLIEAMDGHTGAAVSIAVRRYQLEGAEWDAESAVTFDHPDWTQETYPQEEEAYAGAREVPEEVEEESAEEEEEEEGEVDIARLRAAQETRWALVVDRIVAAAAAVADNVFRRRLACSLYDELFSRIVLQDNESSNNDREPTNFDLPEAYPFHVSTELLSSCQRVDPSVDGIFLHSLALGAVLSAGTHTLVSTFVPSDQRLHRISRLSRQLLVKRSTPLLRQLRLPLYLYENYRVTAYSFFKVEDESVTGVYEYDPPLDTVLPSGNHVLTCSFTPTDLYNYCPVTASREISLTDGRLAEIEWEAPPPLEYPSRLNRYHLCARTRGTLRGTLLYDPPLGTVLPAGEHTLRVHFHSQAEGFRSCAAELSVCVLPAQPRLQWPQPFPIIEGDKLTLVQLNCVVPQDPEGFVSYSPPLQTLLGKGKHELTAQYLPSQAKSGNLLPAFRTITLLVLSKNKLNPIVAWEPIVERQLYFGDKVTSEMCSATANVKGKFFYLMEPGCTLEAGSQTLQVQFEPERCNLYNTLIVYRSVEVLPLRPVITWNKWTKVIPYNSELPDEVFDVRSEVQGVLEFDPPPGAVLPPGAHSVRCRFSPLSRNYCEEEVFDTVTVARRCPLLQWGVEEVDRGGGAAVFNKIVLVSELSREFPYYLEERLFNAKVTQPFNCPGLFRYSHKPGDYLPPGQHTVTVHFYPSAINDLYAADAQLVITVGRATPYVKWELRALPENFSFGHSIPQEFLDARCTELAGGSWSTNVLAGHVPADTGELLLEATFTPADKDSGTYGPATVSRPLVVRPAMVKLEWFDRSELNTEGRPLPGSICYSELQDLQKLSRKFYAVLSPNNSQKVLITFSRKSVYSLSYSFPETFGRGLEISATLSIADERLARNYSCKVLRRAINVRQIEPRMLWIVHFRDRSMPYGTVVSAANVLTCTVDRPGSLAYALVLPSKVAVPLDPQTGAFLDLGRHSLTCTFSPEQPFVLPRVLRLQIDIVFCKPEIAWQLPREVYRVGHVLCDEDFSASIVQRRRPPPVTTGAAYSPIYHRPTGSLHVASALRPGDVLEEATKVKLAVQWVPSKDSGKYYKAATSTRAVRVLEE